ncbi:BRISC complex subunit FAM175B-like [Chelonus insularis]|uniref:BRISC complex subunit FAM175B-like n=1 Tax=Chelonus insularis TaxID=460826 RepID=UPI00158D4E5E|nr:BRISC complex subunit FAM175B-like [Chelonus insularis]
MAENELLVTISGAALSLLFYENLREYGEQMGFFLGNVHTFVTKKVTDADRQVESIKIHTDIQGILPCMSSDLIYGPTGRLNKNKLEEYVKNNKNQIVGWYRFRVNGPLQHTLRDKLLHKQLEKFFCSSNNESSERHFISCILSYSTSQNKGIHRFRHVFLRYKHGLYPPIPLKINNLGVDASRHDGSDYKPTPIKSLINETDFFTKIFETLNIDINRASVMDTVPTILKAAEQHLDDLVTNVAIEDSEIADLEQEALKLKEEVETNRKKISGLPKEDKFSSRKLQLDNFKKQDIEYIDDVDLNDKSQKRMDRLSIDSRKRNSPSVQISNACNNSGSMQKSPSTKLLSSQETKKQPDNTDYC